MEGNDEENVLPGADDSYSNRVLDFLQDMSYVQLDDRGVPLAFVTRDVKGRYPRPSDRCTRCGVLGHHSFACFSIVSGEACFICKKTRHWAKECPIGDGVRKFRDISERKCLQLLHWWFAEDGLNATQFAVVDRYFTTDEMEWIHGQNGGRLNPDYNWIFRPPLDINKVLEQHRDGEDLGKVGRIYFVRYRENPVTGKPWPKNTDGSPVHVKWGLSPETYVDYAACMTEFYVFPGDICHGMLVQMLINPNFVEDMSNALGVDAADLMDHARKRGGDKWVNDQAKYLDGDKGKPDGKWDGLKKYNEASQDRISFGNSSREIRSWKDEIGAGWGTKGILVAVLEGLKSQHLTPEVGLVQNVISTEKGGDQQDMPGGGSWSVGAPERLILSLLRQLRKGTYESEGERGGNISFKVLRYSLRQEIVRIRNAFTDMAGNEDRGRHYMNCFLEFEDGCRVSISKDYWGHLCVRATYWKKEKNGDPYNEGDIWSTWRQSRRDQEAFDSQSTYLEAQKGGIATDWRRKTRQELYDPIERFELDEGTRMPEADRRRWYSRESPVSVTHWEEMTRQGELVGSAPSFEFARDVDGQVMYDTHGRPHHMVWTEQGRDFLQAYINMDNRSKGGGKGGGKGPQGNHGNHGKGPNQGKGQGGATSDGDGASQSSDDESRRDGEIREAPPMGDFQPIVDFVLLWRNTITLTYRRTELAWIVENYVRPQGDGSRPYPQEFVVVWRDDCPFLAFEYGEGVAGMRRFIEEENLLVAEFKTDLTTEIVYHGQEGHTNHNEFVWDKARSILVDLEEDLGKIMTRKEDQLKLRPPLKSIVRAIRLEWRYYHLRNGRAVVAQREKERDFMTLASLEMLQSTNHAWFDEGERAGTQYREWLSIILPAITGEMFAEHEDMIAVRATAEERSLHHLVIRGDDFMDFQDAWSQAVVRLRGEGREQEFRMPSMEVKVFLPIPYDMLSFIRDMLVRQRTRDTGETAHDPMGPLSIEDATEVEGDKWPLMWKVKPVECATCGVACHDSTTCPQNLCGDCGRKCVKVSESGSMCAGRQEVMLAGVYQCDVSALDRKIAWYQMEVENVKIRRARQSRSQARSASPAPFSTAVLRRPGNAGNRSTSPSPRGTPRGRRGGRSSSPMGRTQPQGNDGGDGSAAQADASADPGKKGGKRKGSKRDPDDSDSDEEDVSTRTQRTSSPNRAVGQRGKGPGTVIATAVRPATSTGIADVVRASAGLPTLVQDTVSAKARDTVTTEISHPKGRSEGDIRKGADDADDDRPGPGSLPMAVRSVDLRFDKVRKSPPSQERTMEPERQETTRASDVAQRESLVRAGEGPDVEKTAVAMSPSLTAVDVRSNQGALEYGGRGTRPDVLRTEQEIACEVTPGPPAEAGYGGLDHQALSSQEVRPSGVDRQVPSHPREEPMTCAEQGAEDLRAKLQGVMNLWWKMCRCQGRSYDVFNRFTHEEECHLRGSVYEESDYWDYIEITSPTWSEPVEIVTSQPPTYLDDLVLNGHGSDPTLYGYISITLPGNLFRLHLEGILCACRACRMPGNGILQGRPYVCSWYVRALFENEVNWDMFIHCHPVRVPMLGLVPECGRRELSLGECVKGRMQLKVMHRKLLVPRGTRATAIGLTSEERIKETDSSRRIQRAWRKIKTRVALMSARSIQRTWRRWRRIKAFEKRVRGIQRVVRNFLQRRLNVRLTRRAREAIDAIEASNAVRRTESEPTPEPVHQEVMPRMVVTPCHRITEATTRDYFQVTATSEELITRLLGTPELGILRRAQDEAGHRCNVLEGINVMCLPADHATIVGIVEGRGVVGFPRHCLIYAAWLDDIIRKTINDIVPQGQDRGLKGGARGETDIKGDDRSSSSGDEDDTSGPGAPGGAGAVATVRAAADQDGDSDDFNPRELSAEELMCLPHVLFMRMRGVELLREEFDTIFDAKDALAEYMKQDPALTPERGMECDIVRQAGAESDSDEGNLGRTGKRPVPEVYKKARRLWEKRRRDKPPSLPPPPDGKEEIRIARGTVVPGLSTRETYGMLNRPENSGNLVKDINTSSLKRMARALATPSEAAEREFGGHNLGTLLQRSHAESLSGYLVGREPPLRGSDLKAIIEGERPITEGERRKAMESVRLRDVVEELNTRTTIKRASSLLVNSLHGGEADVVDSASKTVCLDSGERVSCHEPGSWTEDEHYAGLACSVRCPCCMVTIKTPEEGACEICYRREWELDAKDGEGNQTDDGAGSGIEIRVNLEEEKGGIQPARGAWFPMEYRLEPYTLEPYRLEAPESVTKGRLVAGAMTFSPEMCGDSYAPMTMATPMRKRTPLPDLSKGTKVLSHLPLVPPEKKGPKLKDASQSSGEGEEVSITEVKQSSSQLREAVSQMEKVNQGLYVYCLNGMAYPSYGVWELTEEGTSLYDNFNFANDYAWGCVAPGCSDGNKATVLREVKTGINMELVGFEAIHLNRIRGWFRGSYEAYCWQCAFGDAKDVQDLGSVSLHDVENGGTPLNEEADLHQDGGSMGSGVDTPPQAVEDRNSQREGEITREEVDQGDSEESEEVQIVERPRDEERSEIELTVNESDQLQPEQLDRWVEAVRRESRLVMERLVGNISDVLARGDAVFDEPGLPHNLAERREDLLMMSLLFNESGGRAVTWNLQREEVEWRVPIPSRNRTSSVTAGPVLRSGYTLAGWNEYIGRELASVFTSEPRGSEIAEYVASVIGRFYHRQMNDVIENIFQPRDPAPTAVGERRTVRDWSNQMGLDSTWPMRMSSMTLEQARMNFGLLSRARTRTGMLHLVDDNDNVPYGMRMSARMWLSAPTARSISLGNVLALQSLMRWRNRNTQEAGYESPPETEDDSEEDETWGVTNDDLVAGMEHRTRSFGIETSATNPQGA